MNDRKFRGHVISVFLGISIQFVEDFGIEVDHLGKMKKGEKHTADNNRMRNHEFIWMHGLPIEQVFRIG